MKAVYINGISSISAQPTLSEDFLDQLLVENTTIIKNAIEPNYKEYISPAMSRRMSKTVKMSSVTSLKALEEAQIKNPDAIIVGTGIGCSQDSEKFLKNILDTQEEFLTPTYFIQSTHNTVAGQIALALQCHAYNFTYVNTSSALEFSFLDAKLQINDGEANSVLVGASDEETFRTMELYQLNGTIKKPEDIPFDYLQSPTNGVIWGEGSSFFVVEANQKESTYAKLKDIEILNTLEIAETKEFITKFIKKNDLSNNNIDLVILGYSGDKDSDAYYREVEELFPNAQLLYYKHLCGEFNTSSGFSTFMACHILKNQKVPDTMKINNVQKDNINNVLIYNQFFGSDHSLILLEKA